MGELVEPTLTQLVTDPDFNNAPSWNLIGDVTIAGGKLIHDINFPAPYGKAWNAFPGVAKDFYIVELNILSNPEPDHIRIGVTLGSGVGSSIIGFFSGTGIIRRVGQASTIPNEFWVNGSSDGIAFGIIEVEYAKCWKLSNWLASLFFTDYPGLTFANITILSESRVMVQLVNETSSVNILQILNL